MMTRMATLFLIPLCWLVWVGTARAETAARTDPHTDVLRAAQKDVTSRAEAAKNARFAFRVAVEHADRDIAFTLHYDPTKADAAAWTIVKPENEPDSKDGKEAQAQIDRSVEHDDGKTPDENVIIKDLPDANLAQYRFLREENGYWIFGFDPKDTSIFDNAREEKVAEFLRGELGIGVQSGQMAWMRMYSQEGFKPVPVAKIDHFNLLLQFTPAWEGGPLVVKSQDMSMSGSAMFKKFGQDTRIAYSDFQPEGDAPQTDHGAP